MFIRLRISVCILYVRTHACIYSALYFRARTLAPLSLHPPPLLLSVLLADVLFVLPSGVVRRMLSHCPFCVCVLWRRIPICNVLTSHIARSAHIVYSLPSP
ncbi:hypothetical protein L227DRAFT_186888 [Lentinus tigrinus ALCF2SS1-6]|uniref:Uncharacterized protein n=1 Tax=Lentinus tigrinus ALCF2SS1-6 TaxID=1328759 RepID=A0A5C2S4F7_9APHY|nr:hypothetical protein L227DRAFT_186888 [Lentinus tigrinus ALCF2SS1-6]